MSYLDPKRLLTKHIEVASSIFPDKESERYGEAGYGKIVGPGSRPAILVVDVTYEFCGRGPEAETAKASGTAAWDAISVLTTLLPSARAIGVPVVFTKNQLRRHPAEHGAWALKTVAQGNPTDLEIVKEIGPHPDDLVVEKTKPSAFFSTPLSSYLTHLGVDTLIVAGGTTSGCIRATVIDAFSNNYPTFVVFDAVFDRSQTSHEVSLYEMQQKYAGLVGSGSLLDWFQQGA